MAKFSQIPVGCDFSYAHHSYIKISEHNALSLQGHGLLGLQADDDVTPMEDTDGKSETDIT